MHNFHLASSAACCLLLLPSCQARPPAYGAPLRLSVATEVPQQLPPVAPAPAAPPLTTTALAAPSPNASVPLASEAPQATRAGHAGFHRGDWDLRLEGSGSNDNNWKSGEGSITANIGLLMNECTEIAWRQSISMSDSPGVEGRNDGASAIALDFHFGSSGLYPFIGGSFGRIYGDSSDDLWTLAPEAGIKWFVQPDAYLMGMVEYGFAFEHSSDIDDGWKDATFAYTVGFGLRF